MKLIPYDAPRLPEFRNGIFRESSRRWRPKIDLLLFRNRRFQKGLQEFWAHYFPPGRNGRSRRLWDCKLYICLRVRSYWPCLHRLIRKLGRAPFPWKFHMAPVGADRPDKIVFYPHHSKGLLSFVRRLRPLLPRNSFHPLDHAASTAQLGLEGRMRKGIHAGLDPTFLHESWRVYRCLCVGWAEINRQYLDGLPGGRKRWFRRMNLSLEHDGPHTLSPNPADVPYIRRYWKLIRSADRKSR